SVNISVRHSTNPKILRTFLYSRRGRPCGMIANWDDLRVFLALAREGNLTAAARRLDVSHPTVARRIKALEAAIGGRLFDRLPDRFALTAAGEELLADAQA